MIRRVARIAVASVGMLVAWAALDTLAHRLWLAPMYAARPELWRPEETIQPGLVVLATGVLAAVFVTLYTALVRPKSLAAGLGAGGLLGLALGTASGLGTFIHSPIPASLAVAWFGLGLTKGLLAGALLGALVVDGPNTGPGPEG